MTQNQNPLPPKWALRFFRWFCHPDYAEDIEGDLLERFNKTVSEKRNHTGSLVFILEVFKLLRPGIIRSPGGTRKLNPFGMFKTMLTITWRNALRHKQFTILNLFGLSLGIFTTLVIGLYIHNELSYDTFHANADQIYRINQPDIWGDWNERSSSTGPNVAVALRADVPEFKEVTRLLSLGAQTTSIDLEKTSSVYKENAFFAAEENFFEVFSFKHVAGDLQSALYRPNQMIMTLETARRYFGGNHEPEDFIDRKIKVKSWNGTWELFIVKAILRDIPETSHLQFDILVSLKSYQDQMNRDGWKWIWTGFSTYGLVYPEVDISQLEHKIQSLPPKWAAPTTERIFNQTYDEFTAGHPWKLDLQPLKEIYISGDPTLHRFGPTGNPLYVKIFGAIGVLVLLLSAINFMNLSTARASSRVKEVGIRKVLGSQRKTLWVQFVLESTLFVLFGVVLALIAVFISIDWFNQIIDKHLNLIQMLAQPSFILTLLVFVLVLGLLSGSYPAFYLSSFKPIAVLKGLSTQSFKGKSLRNLLVVVQFSISMTLIICTVFVHKQLAFTSRLNLGFESENVLQIHNIDQFGFDTQDIKNRLQALAAVEKVGKSYGIPPYIFSGDRYKAAGIDGPVVQMSNFRTESDYLDLLGVEFVMGRNFDASRPNDKYKVVVNESAVRTLAGDNRALGSPLDQRVALASGNEDEFEIIGVVKDFHFLSVREEIAPMVIIHHQNDRVWDYGAGLSFYSVKLNPEIVQSSDDLFNLIENVEDEMTKIDPTVPFEFSFLDQAFDSTFRLERKMAMVLNIFTVMALLIGCLGLFGLAVFSGEQRTKELAIRKILGASVSRLVLIFSKEFTKLLGISVLIACPIAWYMVDHWLANFAYRTSVDFWVFLLTIIGTLIISIGTVSFQSIKLAAKNPVESLRDE